MIDASKKRLAAPPMPRPWRKAIQRMDEALEQNAPEDYSELIEIFGRAHFGRLWNRKPSNSNNS